MDPAAIDDHDDLFAGFAEGGHHLMEILAQFLGIKVRDDFIEDFRGAILHSAEDREEHAAGDAAPGAIRYPRVAFAGLLACDLALTQGAEREAHARCFAPPARAGQGKAPQDRCVFIEHNDFPTARLVLKGGQCKSPIREVSGVGIQAPGGTIVAYVLFFNTPRTLSRPRWTPVSRAKTVASSRQLHWEAKAPCCRGSCSTRRLRCCSSSQVSLGGRPERGRSRKPCGPSCAKRCTHLRRAEFAKWNASETALIWWPATTSRTACARRKTRAALVCLSRVSRVVSA